MAALVEAVRISGAKQAAVVTEEPFFTRILSGDKDFLTLVLDSSMAFVIVLNCVTIGMSSDYSAGWTGWILLDAIFAFIFLSEVIIQMFLQGAREYLIGHDWRWHIFEIVLVALAILEVSLSVAEELSSSGSNNNNSALFRIMRVQRIIRLFRICRLSFFCDLVVMVNGTCGGIKTVMCGAVLISLPLYAVSLFFRETLGHYESTMNGAEAFRTMPMAFFTVFRCMVVGECTDERGRPIFTLVVEQYGWSYGLVYCVVQVFMTFGLFNVIVAIFVENVLAGAKTNDQLMRRQRLRDQNFWGTKMLEMSALICDINRRMQGRMSTRAATPQNVFSEAQSIQITPALFERLRSTSAFCDILKDLDVCEEDSQALFETLDADVSGSIDMEELLVGIEKLRGEARRSDGVAMNLKISNLVSQFQAQSSTFKEQLNNISKTLQLMSAKMN